VILVDTSVLIDVLRARRTGPSDRLREMVRQGTPYAIPLPCLQEVLQGARDETDWQALKRFLAGEEIVQPRDWRAAAGEAARIFYDCRRRGLTVRSSVDCLIAAIALERNDILLHDDDDFDAIARIRPLRSLRR